MMACVYIDIGTLGQRARMWRAEKQITLEMMANLLGIDPSDLSGMEVGRKVWNLDIARQIEMAISSTHGPEIAANWNGAT